MAPVSQQGLLFPFQALLSNDLGWFHFSFPVSPVKEQKVKAGAEDSGWATIEYTFEFPKHLILASCS